MMTKLSDLGPPIAGWSFPYDRQKKPAPRGGEEDAG